MPIELGKFAVAAVLGAALTGCAANGRSVLNPIDNWGEANRQTMAAQIIDPTPVYDYAVPASSGDLAAKAIERYRTDKVKKPERVQTTNIGTQGGGSGGK